VTHRRADPGRLGDVLFSCVQDGDATVSGAWRCCGARFIGRRGGKRTCGSAYRDLRSRCRRRIERRRRQEKTHITRNDRSSRASIVTAPHRLAGDFLAADPCARPVFPRRKVCVCKPAAANGASVFALGRIWRETDAIRAAGIAWGQRLGNRRYVRGRPAGSWLFVGSRHEFVVTFSVIRPSWMSPWNRGRCVRRGG